MDQGLHYCRSQAQKIEHTNQNKVKSKLLCFSPLFIALNLCTPKCFFLINQIVQVYKQSYYILRILSTPRNHCPLLQQANWSYWSRFSCIHMTYITNYNKHFVSYCYCLHLKPIQGHQLLSDALNALVSMSLELNEKMNHPPL